jgi:NDP-sugar pyrophosphorylase family protein
MELSQTMGYSMNDMDTIERAMILAAGFGTRLKPLTLTTPKPLLPLGETLLIDHQLRYLKKYGIRSVVINLFHLGEQIRRHVGNGSRFGLDINYSEEPEILGTGGGIKQAIRFFGRRPFVVLNADALLAVNIKKLIAWHLKTRSQATMSLKRISEGDAYTPIAVGKTGLVECFGKGDFFYTGLQILGPEIFDVLPPSGMSACLIADGYQELLRRGHNVGAFIYEGYFNDMGTPERYEQAKADIQHGAFKLFSA